MNNRIKELAYQASADADEATDALNDSTGNWSHTWNEMYDQKFAELIIAECNKCVNKYISECGEVSCLPENILEEHFGVK